VRGCASKALEVCRNLQGKLRLTKMVVEMTTRGGIDAHVSRPPSPCLPSGS
jgi:hypothetical protein